MRFGILEETLMVSYGIDELRFIEPVSIGDTIRAKLMMAEIREKELGLVTVNTEVVNQNGETVLKFDAHPLPETRSRARNKVCESSHPGALDGQGLPCRGKSASYM